MATSFRPQSAAGKIGWNIAEPQSVRLRVWLLAGFLALAFGGLGARLWYLQVLEGEGYLAQAQRNRVLVSAFARAARFDSRPQRKKSFPTSRAAHAVAVVPAALPSEKVTQRDARKFCEPWAIC